MAAIAQWLRSSPFATAEEYFLRLAGLILYRRKFCALVGTIAEGLRLALAAGTPEIGLTGLHINCVGCIRCSFWFTHNLFSSVIFSRGHYPQSQFTFVGDNGKSTSTGSIRVPVDKVYTFDEVPLALNEVACSRLLGKHIVRIAENG